MSRVFHSFFLEPWEETEHEGEEDEAFDQLSEEDQENQAGQGDRRNRSKLNILKSSLYIKVTNTWSWKQLCKYSS